MPDIMLTYEEKEDQGAVLVTLRIDRTDKDGKLWQSAITGRGLDRRDAVAAAIPGESLMKLRAAVLKVADEKYVDGSAVPVAAAPVAVAPVEVAQPPKPSSLPGVPEVSQRVPVSGVESRLPLSICKCPEGMSVPLTAKKRGWPKGKPRGPRKSPLESTPTTRPGLPTTSHATPGAQSAETTDAPSSPPSANESSEPF